MSQPIQPISDPNDSNHNLDTESQTTLENPKTINTTFFLSIGFMIWLIATFAVRNFGHNIFKANEPILALGLYLITAIGIIFIAKSLFSWQNLLPSQHFQAAVLLALPGMILDSIIMVSFRTSFPNLVPSSDSAFASWLLWAYAFVLISGFIREGDV